jgi:hypothetical protein
MYWNAVARVCLTTLLLTVAPSEAAVSKELVLDDLPSIEDLLAELGLDHLKQKFYGSGFTETKYILRMKDMDMRIMAMEWGVDKEAIARVKEAIVNYKVERDVVADTEDPLLTLRNSLTYGKLVVKRATSSYEYYTAFGSAAMVISSALFSRCPAQLSLPTAPRMASDHGFAR